MSRIIQQAKTKYNYALSSEIIVLILITGIFAISQNGISFALGALAIFLPHCIFVWLVFFSKKQQISQKMTALYRGEVVKFLLTIGLTVSAFKLFSINILAFFTGYFLTIILNNLFPFLVDKYLKFNKK